MRKIGYSLTMIMVLLALLGLTPQSHATVVKQDVGRGTSRDSGKAADSSSQLKPLAIVIDDFGNNMVGTEEMLNMPVPITAAIMPFLPSTKKDAELAFSKGHDVFVHMPMEPVRGKRSWLGPGAITSDLSNEEIRKRVNEAIDQVPHAVGMNNHMGSKITVDPRIMRVVLSVCKERGLMFLDSKTTHKSVVSSIARELGVPVIENRLFFDDVYTTAHISKQMRLLHSNLGKHPYFVAIGHVGPAGKKTASIIREAIPALQKEAKLVKASQLPSLLQH